MTQSTSGGSTGQVYPPTADSTKPADKPARPTAAATTEAAADTGGNPPAAAEPTAGSTDDGTGAAEYDTYLSSSEPVETKSAPVWVVPGILLVLTSMLALLGGVLGRGNRGTPEPVPVPVKRRRPRPQIDES